MFYLDENVMNDIMGLIDKNIYQVDNMSNGFLGKMTPLTNSGMYGNGTDVIDSQIKSIRDGYINFKTATKSNFDSIISLENRMTKLASEIPLPSNFVAEDTGLSLSVNTTNITKLDGRSVNEGIKETKEEKMTENYNMFEEKLFKLKNLDLEENELKEYKETEKDDLDKIKNDNNILDSELDEYSMTRRNELGEIDNYNTQTVSEFDDSYVNSSSQDEELK